MNKQMRQNSRLSERKLQVAPDSDSNAFCLKVGFMTLDRQHIDQHFGSAKTVLIYGINEIDWHLLEAIEYPEQMTVPHRKLAARIEDVRCCAAVFCNACGASAIRQLMDQQVYPVKVIEGTLIHHVLSGIRRELATEPSGWLARAVRQSRADNVDQRRRRLTDLMDEDW
jgi:nitrogen fixation protein NifX